MLHTANKDMICSRNADWASGMVNLRELYVFIKFCEAFKAIEHELSISVASQWVSQLVLKRK